LEKWENRKWLVNSWYVLLIFVTLLLLLAPSTFNFILFIFVLVATISARTQYKLALRSEERIVNVEEVVVQTIDIPQITNTQTVETITPTQNRPQEPVDYKLFNFNVAGVTAENDKGKDIQRLLKRYGKLHCEENGIELFGGYTNRELIEDGISISEFDGLDFVNSEVSFVPEPTNEYDPNAIKVFIDFGNEEIHHVGYVPKKHTSKLNDILNSQETINIVASYVGGKIKEIDYDFEKDKDVVITKELTLGVEIVIKYK